MELKEKIESCKTMPQLDALRLEIVQNGPNGFKKLQTAFIKKKNQLLRIPLRDRT